VLVDFGNPIHIGRPVKLPLLDGKLIEEFDRNPPDLVVLAMLKSSAVVFAEESVEKSHFVRRR
jgi:hypothetical protein